VVPMEEKLNQAHVEVQQLKSSVRNYEDLIETYKSQVGAFGIPSSHGCAFSCYRCGLFCHVLTLPLLLEIPVVLVLLAFRLPCALMLKCGRIPFLSIC